MKSKPSLDRRRFIKSSGLALALPFLESFGLAKAATLGSSPKVKRLVTIDSYLGLHTPSWFPKNPGQDYQIPEMLKPLEGMRNQFSLFSGLDHRSAHGHRNWRNFLVGKGTPSISMDQIVANAIGHQTRFASLQVTCGNPPPEGQISFNKEGIHLPEIGRPSVLFDKLFSSDSDKERIGYLLDSGKSVLDQVYQEAKTLKKKVSRQDSRKLDEYFSSIREVEKNVAKQKSWLDKPSPSVDFTPPEFDPIAPDLSLECEDLMYELIALALQTDSTRVISFVLPGASQVFTFEGKRLSAGYHGLSHHGNDSIRLAEYNRIGKAHMEAFSKFLKRIQESTDFEERPLLDTTAIFFGSGMGDANTHNNSNLPALLAGGSFKHGNYHAIDREQETDTTPLLGDLYLTIMQSMGLEIDRFVKAKRNMNEYIL